MSVDIESLKRVLGNIKGAARGFHKEGLERRLKGPSPMDDAPGGDGPLATGDNPLEGSPDEEAAETPLQEGLESPGLDAAPGSEDAEAKLAMIRKLIGSV